MKKRKFYKNFNDVRKWIHITYVFIKPKVFSIFSLVIVMGFFAVGRVLANGLYLGWPSAILKVCQDLINKNKNKKYIYIYKI